MDASDPAGMAGVRSVVYGLLARLFRDEPDADLLRRLREPAFLSALEDIGAGWSGDVLAADDGGRFAEALVVEFARLFLGPGPHLSPHESVHHRLPEGKWGALWGDSTVAAMKFMKAAGLELSPDVKLIPDHISVELEFMSMVSAKEADAWQNGDTSGAVSCLDIEKRFLGNHLAAWVPSFCEKVIEAAQLPMYRAVAELTRDFVSFEADYTGRLYKETVETRAPQPGA